jgi:hypothetical protein
MSVGDMGDRMRMRAVRRQRPILFLAFVVLVGLATLALIVDGISSSLFLLRAASGLGLVLGLLAWFLIYLASIAFLMYLLIVGRSSWRAMKGRSRSLRRPSFKW